MLPTYFDAERHAFRCFQRLLPPPLLMLPLAFAAFFRCHDADAAFAAAD